MNWKAVDTKLSTLKDILDEKQSQQQKVEYYQYIHIFNLVLEFAIKQKLVIYGGTALNELLPKSNKFYSNFELPDYDMFSFDAKKHAVMLSNYLVKSGIKYVEVKDGLHAGTYKVYAEFKSVADITQVNHNFYKFILQEAAKNPTQHTKNKQLLVSPIIFLKWSFHRELSSPESSLHRWEKVYKRFLLFSETYQQHRHRSHNMDTLPLPTTHPDKPLGAVTTQLKDIIKTMQYPVVGLFGIGLHLGKRSTVYYDPYISSFEILSENIEETKTELSNFLTLPEDYELESITRSTEREDKNLYFTDILPPRVRLFLVHKEDKRKRYPLITITQVSDNCFSIHRKYGYVVGSTDTILQLLYAYQMTYMHFMKGALKKRVVDIIASLIDLCNGIDMTTKKRFSLSCFGVQKTLADVRKSMWDKKPFRYRPRQTVTPPSITANGTTTKTGTNIKKITASS